VADLAGLGVVAVRQEGEDLAGGLPGGRRARRAGGPSAARHARCSVTPPSAVPTRPGSEGSVAPATRSASLSAASAGWLTRSVPGTPDGWSRCWSTWASSCASSCRPRWVSGRPPAPSTTWWPNVYACAWTVRADSWASGSSCTLTRPKSWPNRDSIRIRVAASSGRPGERRTSCTTGGAVAGPARPALALRRRCSSWPQLPGGQASPPHRWSRLLGDGVTRSGRWSTSRAARIVTPTRPTPDDDRDQHPAGPASAADMVILPDASRLRPSTSHPIRSGGVKGRELSCPLVLASSRRP
jgi:hypothetical protein